MKLYYHVSPLQRRLRPGAEYCHDEVDDHLAKEQRNLLEIINKLEAGLVQVGGVAMTALVAFSLSLPLPLHSILLVRLENVTASCRKRCWNWRMKSTKSATVFILMRSNVRRLEKVLVSIVTEDIGSRPWAGSWTWIWIWIWI